MTQKTFSLETIVTTLLEKLADEMASLNARSDEITRYLFQVEQALVKMGVGFRFRYELLDVGVVGYDRMDGHWCFVYENPDGNGLTTLQRSPRKVRLRFHAELPQILSHLLKEVEKI